MRGIGIVAAAVWAAVSRSEDIQFIYIVTTDKSLYRVGDQVHWTLEAYIQDSRGTELWKSDGTEAGTMRVADLVVRTDSLLPQNLTAVYETAALKVLHMALVRDKLVLVVDAGQSGQAVWVFAVED